MRFWMHQKAVVCLVAVVDRARENLIEPSMLTPFFTFPKAMKRLDPLDDVCGSILSQPAFFRHNDDSWIDLPALQEKSQSTNGDISVIFR